MRSPVAALALLAAVSACGSSDRDADTAESPPPTPAKSGASGDPTGESDGVAPVWNPCADLAPGRVGTWLGGRVTRETGTDTEPRCAFLPVTRDGPTLNVTYLWFEGSFEGAWSSMGRIDGDVTDPDIAGSDSARLVVNATRKAVLVTGFVKTGDLVETVNAVQLAPYDRAALVDASRRVMTTLARNAPVSPQTAPQG